MSTKKELEEKVKLWENRADWGWGCFFVTLLLLSVNIFYTYNIKSKFSFMSKCVDLSNVTYASYSTRITEGCTVNGKLIFSESSLDQILEAFKHKQITIEYGREN